MHRIQIYFDEPLFEEIRRQANAMDISLSAYIRNVIKKDLDARRKKSPKIDLSRFEGMWAQREISQESLREEAWFNIAGL